MTQHSQTHPHPARKSAKLSDPPPQALPAEVRDKWSERLAEAVLKGHLRAGGQKIGLALLSFAGEGGLICPSQTDIARRASRMLHQKITPWVVRVVLGQMVGLGLLRVWERGTLEPWPGGPPGARRFVQISNAYIIVIGRLPNVAAPMLRRLVSDAAAPPGTDSIDLKESFSSEEREAARQRAERQLAEWQAHPIPPASSWEARVAAKVAQERAERLQWARVRWR